ncbi:hypothetical protein ABEF95_002185 [Exophiala dermatitidis]
MPFSSWFLKSKGQPEVDHDGSEEVDGKTETSSPDELLDFETIADRVEALQQELAYAHHLCEQANLQFDKYRTDLHELKQSVATLQNENEVLRCQLAMERERNMRYRAQIQEDQDTIKSQKVLVTQLQARLNTETTSLHAMAKHARTLEQRLIDAKFDLEYLKCTTDAEQQSNISPSTQNLDVPLPAQPFVVVLVDGDAYKWHPDLFLNSSHVPGNSGAEASSPGGLAASQIRTEVIKYILKQDGTIPITSKVITRVFCNYGYEQKFLNRQRARSAQIALRDFAVQFTEKIPLFDYFDAGRGKERADDKIRENFHLYLSTPNCHAIFLAACLDNGFARMLEQYSNDPLAYQKIVLVTPGYMALEVQKLGFKQVMWSNVFATKAMPKEMVARYEKDIQKSRSLGDFSSASANPTHVKAAGGGRRRGTGGAPTPNLTKFLLERVPTWDLNDAMARYTNGVGLKIPHRYDGDETDPCIVLEDNEVEEGVD